MTVKAKFQYTIWSQTGPKAGSRQVRSWNLAYHLARYQRTSTSVRQVRDQLRTCLRPASSRFELSRHVKTALRQSKLAASQTGSKLVVADRQRTGIWPIIMFKLSLHVEIARTCSKLVADRFEAKFHYAVCDQIE